MNPGLFQITLKVFITRGAELLVLRDRKQQVGDLPGGRLGPGEIYRPWSNSIHREIGEELGPEFFCRLNPEPIFLFPHFIQESGYEALGLAFAAEYLQGEIQLSDEHDWHAWKSLPDYDAGELFTDHLLAAVRRFQRSRP